MLYSIKKATGHETAKDKSTNKKKLWDNTHSLSLHPHPDMNQPPPPIPSPIIHNNNTMDTEFQVQMRQSNKCGSVRNDEIFNLHLGSGAGPWVSIPCLLQGTSYIYWFHPPKQIARKKERTPEMRFNLQQIVSYCLGLRTQNPGLREVDLEPSPKRGSEKINMLK